jgi:hypothetical protein
MKRIMLLFIAALASEAFAMELPPTFAESGKQEEHNKKSLYKDKNAIDKFHKEIEDLTMKFDRSDIGCKKMGTALDEALNTHLNEIEIYWAINKELVIADAKAACDHARALVIAKAVNSKLGTQHETEWELLRAHRHLALLKRFETKIANAKRLQNPEKK